MRSRRSAREELRIAVECLPRRTRVAMLEGIRGNDIIVGAYVDRKGGVCPMLAAHRCGGRTDFLAFAHSWDRFTYAKRPRRATEREIAVLVSYLEASLISDDLGAAGGDRRAAIADHQAAARQRRTREALDLGIRLEDIAREPEPEPEAPAPPPGATAPEREPEPEPELV